MSSRISTYLDDKEVIVLKVNRVTTSADKRRGLAAILVAILALAVMVPAALTTTARAAGSDVVDVLFDFENGGVGGNGDGYLRYDDDANASAAPAAISGIGDGSGIPGVSSNDFALKYTFDVTMGPNNYGGIGWNAPSGNWDFSANTGIQFWVYGEGAASSFQLEVQDKASGSGQSENWESAAIPVTPDEWNLVSIPFADLVAAGYQPDASRNHTLDLDAVSAILLKAVGKGVVNLDNVAVYTTTPAETVDVWRDFEANLGDGYESYEQAGAVQQLASELPAYGAEPNQYVLSYGFNTTLPPNYGGIQWFSPSTASLWDFSNYDGIQMWVYGDGSGADFQIELQDLGAGPSSPELFDINIPVGDPQWRLVKVPFADITLATDYQPNPGGHNGVLDLDAIRAVALPAGNNANSTVKIDNIAFYAGGVVPPSVRIGTIANPFEGGTVTVPIVLNKPASGTVTVQYATVDQTAVAGTDYTATSGTATITAGQLSTSITIDTMDNLLVDGNRTFTVQLSNPHGASLGTATATVTIRDDDFVLADKLTLLHDVSEDFEAPLVYGPTTSDNPAPLGWTGVFGGSNVPVVTQVEDVTVPGAVAGNQALDVDFDTASWTALIYRFSSDGTSWTTQDWAQYRGVGFWMKGTNSGTRLFLDVLDNRNAGSTSDDAERYSHPFVDDFNGWKFVELPLSAFTRKDTGNGAPNDGFSLSDIHGFAIGNEAGSGHVNLRFDDFVLVKFQQKVEDFESALPVGAGTPPVGWVSVSGGGNDPVYTTVPEATHPLALADNDVLSVDVTSGNWGALVRSFGTGTTWTSQDWSAYLGVGFWFKGSNSGNTYAFDVLDNRNSGSTTDDAERFTTTFVDDTADWKFVELPFSSFGRKDIGNSAPNDGFGRTAVHGYGLVHEGGIVDSSFLIDDVTLIGDADRAQLNVGFDGQQFSVTEGGAAQVVVKINRVTEEPISVGYTTVSQADGTTSRYAVPGRDYTQTSGTLTIPAGQRTATVSIPTTEDDKPESNEVFRVRLVDGNDPNLTVNTAEATVTIIDNDTPNPLGLEDFEYGQGQVRGVGTSLLDVREIPSSSNDAYPGQHAYNHVLDVSPGIDGVAGLSREFASQADWSGNSGLGFWYNGTGNNQIVTAFVRDSESSAADAPEWDLAWSDEFDGVEGSAPNPAHWTNEINGHGWGNQELQYYTDSRENSAHDGDGHLVITLREITDQAAFKAEQNAKGYPETCHYGDCLYTSARLNSYDKVEFQYGRVESRAQLPDGEKGLWPAIWALGTSFFEGTDWPASGEIDIMEYVGKLPDEIFGTIHGPGFNGGNAVHNIHDFNQNLGKKWMRFAIEWEPDEIRWYVALDSAENVEDGEWIHFHTATRQMVEDRGGEWVFEAPEFFIMNFAIGGNFGETPAPGITYPQEFKVDYVRVFKQASVGDTYEYSFVDDADGWRYIELPFSGFKASADQLAGAPGDGLSLDRIAAYSITVTAPGSQSNGGIVPRFAAPMAAAAATQGPVSFDNIQVLSTVTTATPWAVAGGGTGGTGTGGLGATGVEDTWVAMLLVAMVLAVAGGGLLTWRRMEKSS